MDSFNMDTIYIVHGMHGFRKSPNSQPIKISYAVFKFTSIAEAVELVTPKDEHFELVECWIEVRFPPMSMRKKGEGK